MMIAVATASLFCAAALLMRLRRNRAADGAAREPRLWRS